MRFLITLCFLLSTLPVRAALNDVEKAFLHPQNQLVNPGFENGKSSWSAPTGFSITTDSAEVLRGKASAAWDATAATQDLESEGRVAPIADRGRNGVASCLVMVPSGTATHTFTVVSGVTEYFTPITIPSSTTPQRVSGNFIFPSNDDGFNIKFVAVAANEPEIIIDDCYLGSADGFNVGQYAAATFVGGMENAGSGATCSYSESSSTSISNFVDLSAGTSCAAWTVVSNGPGTISAQGTNDHRLVYTNMPPGNYKIEISAFIEATAIGTCMWRLSDGTNTYQAQGYESAATYGAMPTLNFHVTVTTAATRTYKLQAADNHAGACRIQNLADLPASWKIYRYPTTSEQSYTADKLANSWSGYHDNTCSWARTNTAYGDPTADASCALVELTNNSFGTVTSAESGGNKLPGIVFTPSRAGRYFVCATGGLTSSVTLGGQVSLLDGSTKIDEAHSSIGGTGFHSYFKLCGIVVATSTAAKTLKLQTSSTSGTVTMAVVGVTTYATTWSIFQIDQSFPAPNLVNSVVSPSSGVERITRAAIANPAGTPSITSQSGSWVSSLTDNNPGDITLNIQAGTFSAAPTCTVTNNDADDLGVRIDSVSTSALRVGTFNAGSGARVETGFNVICIGPR